MADYVLNEWVWGDLRGENGVEKQGETFKLLCVMLEKADRLVVVKGSAFDKKAWDLCGADDVLLRKMGAFYRGNFRFNSGACIELNQAGLGGLPDVLADVEARDRYLVQSLRAVAGSILISTDRYLLAVVNRNGMNCQHRDEFVPVYLREAVV